MQLLNANGSTVYLEVGITQLISRIKNTNNHRPLLNTSLPGWEIKVAQLISQRIMYYEQAKYVVNTDLLTEEQSVEKIATFLVT